jgi:hypothetical protein
MSKYGRRFKRYLPITILLLLLSIFLAACGGSDTDRVAVAADYMEALNNQEFDAISNYVCDERADEINNALMTVTEEEEMSFSFENVQCSARGADVLCRYTLRQEQNGVENRSSLDVTFSFEDGRICGFEQTTLE